MYVIKNIKSWDGKMSSSVWPFLLWGDVAGKKVRVGAMTDSFIF